MNNVNLTDKQIDFIFINGYVSSLLEEAKKAEKKK